MFGMFPKEVTTWSTSGDSTKMSTKASRRVMKRHFQFGRDSENDIYVARRSVLSSHGWTLPRINSDCSACLQVGPACLDDPFCAHCFIYFKRLSVLRRLLHTSGDPSTDTYRTVAVQLPRGGRCVGSGSDPSQDCDILRGLRTQGDHRQEQERSADRKELDEEGVLCCALCGGFAAGPSFGRFHLHRSRRFRSFPQFDGPCDSCSKVAQKCGRDSTRIHNPA